MTRDDDDENSDPIQTGAASSTPARTPPPLLQDIYNLVADSPVKETWMKAKVYKEHAVEHINVTRVQTGIENYQSLVNVKSSGWQVLTEPDSGDDMEFDDTSELDAGEVHEEYEFPEEFTTSLAEIETIKKMRFDPSGHTKGHGDLYTHSDGSTKPRFRPDYKHPFENSASLSFFAYLHLYFRRQIVHEMNEYAFANNTRTSSPFTLSEQAFFEILFYMALYNNVLNYWGAQPEDRIFGGSMTSLDAVMMLNRFKLLQRCLSFNATPLTLKNDAAARIRPMRNLLKATGDKYVAIRRNIALDEESVACRSRQGRHLIVLNPMEPTGKYHCRLYVLCCSSSWITLNYPLHCNRSDIVDRIDEVVAAQEILTLQHELKNVSKIRQHMLEVTRPLFGTN
ncbi:hypothetical protein PC114_g22505 [Phytophthora cactorum]|nr:hypothetical protein PC114_g22505 [Phytophthora cactorum]